MKSREKLETYSVQAARAMSQRDPTIRAAIIFGPENPLKDSSKARVRLFEKVGDADKYLRQLLVMFEEDGWVKVWGAFKYGAFELERDGRKKYIGIDKRATPRPSATIE